MFHVKRRRIFFLCYVNLLIRKILCFSHFYIDRRRFLCYIW